MYLNADNIIYSGVLFTNNVRVILMCRFFQGSPEVECGRFANAPVIDALCLYFADWFASAWTHRESLKRIAVDAREGNETEADSGDVTNASESWRKPSTVEFNTSRYFAAEYLVTFCPSSLKRETLQIFAVCIRRKLLFVNILVFTSWEIILIFNLTSDFCAFSVLSDGAKRFASLLELWKNFKLKTVTHHCLLMYASGISSVVHGHTFVGFAAFHSLFTFIMLFLLNLWNKKQSLRNLARLLIYILKSRPAVHFLFYFLTAENERLRFFSSICLPFFHSSWSIIFEPFFLFGVFFYLFFQTDIVFALFFLLFEE